MNTTDFKKLMRRVYKEVKQTKSPISLDKLIANVTRFPNPFYASDTKAAILSLIEEGKIQLDDLLSLVSLRKPEKKPKKKEKTLADLPIDELLDEYEYYASVLSSGFGHGVGDIMIQVREEVKRRMTK